MPSLGNERYAVQNTLIGYVREPGAAYGAGANGVVAAAELGWEYISPEECERLRGGRSGLILREVFSRQMLKLNASFIDNLLINELASGLERLHPSVEGNLHAWEYLRGIKTIFVPREKRERNVTLLSRDPRQNIYHVTDEFSFTNGKYTNRYDIVFFINGIPVLYVETKASHKSGAIDEALQQVNRYHAETPEAISLLQVYSLTHIVHFFYAATWSLSVKNLFNWKEESGSRDYESLVKSFFSKNRVVSLLLDYILFTRKDDELQKVVLRPHQMRAIGKIVERAADRKKKRGLIWHTQGSGKTYTMIVAAQKIIENPVFENPTVLMLVDRNELEAQLFGNLASAGVKYVHIAESKKDLRELLKRDTRGLIVSMIHKFEGMPANINTRKNIFVLVDEAHRTTGGDLGNYLMAALPDATYIGFTGTPIDKTSHGKGTFITFGRDDEPRGYLDKYGIAESIDDGTTVKLHYSLAQNELLPDRDTLEKEFLDLKETEGVSDVEELNRVLEKAVTLKNMLKNRERIRKVTESIVAHYRDYVEPLGYKAFIVAVDREACALYKEELDRHLPPEYSNVVISPFHNDPELLKKYHLSEEQEKRVRKAFIKPDQMPKILIVTEKLLTGFDAPVLYCMYLDKPMRDHVLLQAIARVNRPYEDENGIKKPCGFILDFVGIFDKLEKALAFDSEDISGVVQDLRVLKDLFVEKMKVAEKEYLPVIRGVSGDKAVEAVLNHFLDEEERKEFYCFYNELSDLYEILSPDAFLRPYIDDYDTLSRMVRILKEAYEPALLVSRDFARKTALLVQKNTKTGAIKTGLEIYEINGDTVRKLEESRASDTEKVFNLLKSIRKEIAEKARNNPYLISIGERAERISEMFRQRQINTEEALEKLKEIVKGINEAHRERAEKNMTGDVFSVYWVLREERIAEPERLAEEAGEAFSEYPHWRESGDHERELRKRMYKILIGKYDNLKELVDRILVILKGAAE